MQISNKVRTILLVFLTTVFVLSSSMLIFTIIDREKAKNDFDELTNIVNTPEDVDNENNNTPQTENPLDEQPQTTVKPSSPAITRNITLLKKMNNECVGWVYIKGTKVNYPVMHTPQNPEKYLKKNFHGKYSGSGVPFIDARCNLDGTNIIIYGHNMKNLTIFGGLRKYLDEKYLKDHPIIEFETLNGVNYYKITQVKKTDIYDKWFTHNLYAKQDGKEYLTLSTCYGSNKKARLLIIAEKQQ